VHPDPLIAASAFAWAYRSRTLKSRLDLIFGLLFDFTIGLLLNDTGAGAGWSERLAYRRAAKRLVRLHEQSAGA
jgi:hypothetical protein